MIRVQRTLPARLLLAGASAAALATGMPAIAQDTTGDDEALTIDTIVVTARRRDESIVEVPIAVSTFDADKLDMRGALDITALQRNTPNLTLQVSRGTNSTLTAFIRGVGQQDPLWGFEPGVGLYVDDVYIARPQGAILDIFDIERIEVLRGPQGTLYGRNTIGGAVKYITRRLGQEPSFKVRTNLGNYEQRDLVASGSVPLGNKVALGAAVGWYNRDGYGTNHFTGAETNNKKSFAARLTLEATPSENLFFRLSADRTDDDSNTNHGHREAAVPADWAVLPAVLPGYSPSAEPVPAGAFPVQANKYDTWAGLGDEGEVITQGLSGLVEWTLSDSLTFKSITAYRDGVTHGTGIDFDGTPAPILDISAGGTVYDDHQFSEELQLVIQRDSWSGILGAYYLDALATGQYDTILGIGAAAIPGVPTPHLTQGTSGEVDTKSIALFGDFDFDIGERWNLSLGGRWTRDKKEGTVFKANYLGLGSPISGVNSSILIQTLTDYTRELTFEEFTPRVSLSYALADDMNVYAAYSRGFKSGGFDMRGDATATPATQEGYEPETVDSFEIGLKGNVLDGRLSFAGAIFHTLYDGQQVTSQQVNQAGTGVVSFVDNVGSSTINGAELEATAWFSNAFSVDFALGYVDAEFDEYLAYAPSGGGYVQVDVADQRQFQNTPEWNGNVALNYMIDMDTRGTLALRGALSFRSSINMFETPVPAIDQPAYELLDASIVWTAANEKWRVGIHGRNLTNERYRTGAYNFPGLAFGDSIIGFYGAPRTIFASIEYRY
ncbi:TonB-dependent receptor [Pseudokordiimonas caeni]|uniref:TonB-dependent receptor n=1 Tax=Pseudokordiimonas caeni TaxID=2997908 RepID=UPI00281191BC|nr:TonB-dependent receptor [Pseudokordiimonas caeni]